jgi:DNA-binding SARP family transcriptional activator
VTSRLRVLGPFELRSGGSPVRLGRKSQALLAHLAIGGSNGSQRSSLISLLWADHDEEGARNALRQCLHQIRRSIGEEDLIYAEGDMLRLSGCEVDLWRFGKLVANPTSNSLCQAGEIFGGPLACGLAATAEFDQWLEGERQRLRHEAQGVLARLALAALSTAEFETAIEFAQRLLRDDPLHEGCHRSLMVLYDRVGLRAKAVQTWDECVRILRTELGVEPSSETRTLHERLRGPHASNVSALAFVGPPSANPVHAASQTRAHDHMLRGWQFYFLGSPADNARAREAFAAALADDPGKVDAATLYAWTYFTDFMFGWNAAPSWSFAQARRLADLGVAEHSGHPLMAHLDGKLLLWQMDYEGAVRQLERALAGHPSSPQVHANLADAQMRCGNCDEALRLVNRAKELEPNDRGFFRSVEGQARFCMGELDAARQAFESALTRHPQFCVARIGLASTWVELGELARARSSATMALAHFPRLSVDYAQDVVPMRDGRQRARIVDAWRAAGLPEHEGPFITSQATPHAVA